MFNTIGSVHMKEIKTDLDDVTLLTLMPYLEKKFLHQPNNDRMYAELDYTILNFVTRLYLKGSIDKDFVPDLYAFLKRYIEIK